MADFVAVLKKTLDGLNDPTPELRQRVYDKARATISAKLAAITPPPPKAVAERQKRALEDAIATVEQRYPDRPGPKISPDPLAELDDVFASIERQKKDPPKKADAESIDPVPPAAEPAAEPEPEPESPPPPEVESLPEPKAESWPKTTPVVAPPPPAPTDAPDDDVLPAPSQGFGHEPGYEPQQDNDPFASAEDEREHTYQRKRGYGLIAALVAIAALAAGGYGIWLNKEALFGPNAPAPVAAAPEQPASPQQPADEPATETAALPPAEEEPAPVAEEPATPQKFTQRLTPEGKEIDAGPAGGATSLGEGTSLAAVTQPPAGSTSPQPQEAPSASEPSVAVGQRAIFYEERTNVAQGSAEPGSIVWSLVQESPGGDLPPEPAIRAEATIPGKDVQLRMTIRRNADQTLPASHIIEVIFLTPEGFEGGGIENILRVSMKGSEQEAGSPLIGIPAKIADGFFLIALNDGKAEIDANMTLLRRQSWIDVPVIYKSGRRALFTMEKGIPGQKAFEEAIKAWQEAASAEGEGNG